MSDILTCGSSLKNMSAFQCEANYGLIRGVMLSLEKTSFTFAESIVEANWIAEINKTLAERLFVFPFADDVIRNQGDAVFKDTNTNDSRQVHKGVVDFEFHYFETRDCVWNIFSSFNGQKMYAFFNTQNDAILGADDGTNFFAIPVEVFTSEPIAPENKDEPWMIKLYVRLKNTVGNFTKAVLPNSATYMGASTRWQPSLLEGIVDVTMTEVSSSTTEIIVDVVGACDGREITDLVEADFTALAGQSGITNSGNRYTIAGTFAPGAFSVALKNQPAMTTKGYEQQTALDVTVV